VRGLLVPVDHGSLTSQVFITEVELTVADQRAAAGFFAEALERPTNWEGDRVEVAIGASRLVLLPGQPSEGVHHLAFDIPPDQFDEHRDWLVGRMPLLSDADGRTEFEGPPGWNSRSVYFTGPDRMVLELIARRERPRARSSVPALLSISEVGIAVDVPEATRVVSEQLAIGPLGSAGPEFAPMGNHDGLLILVSPGRRWIPALDTFAEALPLVVRVEIGGTPTTFQLNKLARIDARSLLAPRG